MNIPQQVRVTSPNKHETTLSIDSPVLPRFLLHAAGGGFNEQQTAVAIEANHDLHDGKEVVLGNWRFEPVEGEL